MSDYISKSALVEKFEERMKDDNVMCPIIKVLDVLDIIDDAPTLDEKDIIRKTFERIVEELKKEVMIEDSLSKNSTGEFKKMHTYGRNCLNVAIKKIKECEINE